MWIEKTRPKVSGERLWGQLSIPATRRTTIAYIKPLVKMKRNAAASSDSS